MRGNVLRKFVSGAALSAAALFGVSQANASLVVSLVPTSGNTTNVAPGTVVNFNVVATITGDGTTDSLTSLYGAVTSTPGGPVGNAGNFVPNSAFNNNNSQNGTQQDLNGLPGLDLGNNNSAVTTDWIFLRVPDATNPASGTDPATFTLGTVQFTVTAANAGTTTVQWVPRTGTTAAQWHEGTALKTGSSGSYTAGPGVAVTAAPEPGSLALLGLGGFGLLLRRRRAM